MALKTSKDGKFVVSGSGDGLIKIFNLQTYQEMHHIEKIHERIITKKPF